VAIGYSAIASYKAGTIKENDYVIGFNFAAFLPHKFDFYFCEETSRIDKKTSRANVYKERTKYQFMLLKKRKSNMSNIIFKNLCFSNPKLMKELTNDVKYSIVWDNTLISNKDAAKLFSSPSIIMPQYSSTVITAVMLAYHAGFTNIVVHGLDFSGPHIYHDEDLQKQVGLSTPTPCVSKEIKHITASAQELIWPYLIKEFSKRGVNIFSASFDSNFKRYAPIYF
jgi:hypothetical protein